MECEIDKAFRAAQDMNLAIRGLYGEGTEATGDFFQVSNQVTLGISEEQIVENFRERIVPSLVDYERLARESLLKRRRAAIQDKVYRSLAMLQSARVITSQETMYLLSMVRLGLNAELIDDVDLKTINELFLLTQPAHLQKILQRELSEDQRDEARATYLRQRLGTF